MILAASDANINNIGPMYKTTLSLAVTFNDSRETIDVLAQAGANVSTDHRWADPAHIHCRKGPLQRHAQSSAEKRGGSSVGHLRNSPVVYRLQLLADGHCRRPSEVGRRREGGGQQRHLCRGLNQTSC